MTSYAAHILAAEIGGRHEEVRKYRALEAHGGNMTDIDKRLRRALDALADDVIPHGQALAELRQTEDRYPAAFVASERARIIRAARAGDAKAVDLAAQYRDAALAEARKLRTQADADRPAAERTAEMLERQQILAGNPRASDLLAQAEAALAAERPQRAAFLVDVARSVGGTVLGDLPNRVEDALDASDPARAAARTVEDQVERALGQFQLLRARTLAAAGLGMTGDGSAGTGSSEEVARANVARKMTAYAMGEDFSDPAPEHGDGIVAVSR